MMIDTKAKPMIIKKFSQQNLAKSIELSTFNLNIYQSSSNAGRLSVFPSNSPQHKTTELHRQCVWFHFTIYSKETRFISLVTPTSGTTHKRICREDPSTFISLHSSRHFLLDLIKKPPLPPGKRKTRKKK